MINHQTRPQRDTSESMPFGLGMLVSELSVTTTIVEVAKSVSQSQSPSLTVVLATSWKSSATSWRQVENTGTEGFTVYSKFITSFFLFGPLKWKVGLIYNWTIMYIIYTKWFLPARRYASAGNSDRNVSVCPSVRPSVKRRYCVKTKKASGMISSPSGSPKTLVFRRQISSPNSKGFPPNGGLKQGSVGKIERFSSFLENGSRYGQSYY